MMERAGRKRHIELLPNALTTGAMFLGFYSVLLALKGAFELAVLCVFGAMILDSLDGFIARLLNSQSKLGQQLDSLSDFVSFGVAPALICYVWGTSSLGRLAIGISFYYVACTAIRLGRFNIQANTSVFYGLNSPCSAALPLGLVWIAQTHDVTGWFGYLYPILVAAVQIIAATLMVTKIKYISSKKIGVQYKLRMIFALVVVLAIVLVDPPIVVTALFVAYALSGPIAYLRRSKNPEPVPEQPSVPS
jgi:CDP-diacylglycerol--serine O-phosphatidyltransferase